MNGLQQLIEHPSNKPSFGLKNISVVIATRNFGHRLEATLHNWLRLDILELLVIDGYSEDESPAVLEKLGSEYRGKLRVEFAKPLGLADARQRGTKLARGQLVLHAGPDNLIPAETIGEMIRELEFSSLVSCQTKLLTVNSYLDRCHDLSKRRFPAGRNLAVVGTPYLALKSTFEDYPFNVSMQDADDTELCDRLRGSGHLISRVPAYCFEHGFSTIGDFRDRWMRWGRGDALYFREKNRDWCPLRRLKSLLHPFEAEIIQPKKFLTIRQYVFALPFFFGVAMLRILGWATFGEKKLSVRANSAP